MGPKVQVLDHGYLQLVEHWGSDERIIEAARMSTDKGFLGWGKTPKCDDCGTEWPDMWLKKTLIDVCGACGRNIEVKLGDEKLLRYLYENKHSTPFEMAGVTFEIQAPIFVFREWHR